MGQFSWLDCITKEQVIDNACCDVYVLIPKEFGGGHIKETCYDGYGHFGGHDIYELVVDWNTPYIDQILKEKSEFRSGWVETYEEDFRRLEKGEPIRPETEKRILGIAIACYDEDNERLRYPIKITHDPTAVYERCGMSESDPDQGWPPDEDDDDETWY